MSGFNYSDETGKKGIREQEYTGGLIIHKKKNLILNNYYPYNLKKLLRGYSSFTFIEEKVMIIYEQALKKFLKEIL